jgi:hypothetical protein
MAADDRDNEVDSNSATGDGATERRRDGATGDYGDDDNYGDNNNYGDG